MSRRVRVQAPPGEPLRNLEVVGSSRARFGPLVKVQLQMHLDYDEYDGVSEYSDYYEEEDDE